MTRRVYTIVGFEDGDFLVRCGAKKIEKMSEGMVMTHGVLIPKDCCEPKKSVVTQEYMNKYFQHLFENRQKREYEARTLEGYVIDDEVVEDFDAIAEN